MTDHPTGGASTAKLRSDPAARSSGSDTDAGRAAATAGDREGCPYWFQYLVVVGCSATLSFGGFGLLLAVIGWFSPLPALLLGAVGTVAGTAAGRPRRRELAGPSSPPSTVPAIAMCAVAAAIAAWNGFFTGHHVAVDIDPGVYAVTGRWLADHHSLIVPAGAAWSGTGLPVGLSSAGVYFSGGTSAQFQFAHLWPSLLGEAYSVGGAGLMFRMPAIVGALGLCTVFMVGCRLIARPWVVLVSVTALGISLPELFVTRDTYSEPVTQVLLWFGVWLLMRAYEDRRQGAALLAGLAIGGTVMTHIDAVIYLCPLPLLGALAWVTARSPIERRSLLRILVAVALGVLPPALLGTFDVQRRAGQYYNALRPDVVSLYYALLLATVGAVVFVLIWLNVGLVRSLVTGRRRQLGTLAGWIVAIGLVLAWSLRPAGPKAVGISSVVVRGLQRAENVPIQPHRTYAEQSLRWIEWYIGPVGVGLAIAGLSLLTFRVITRESTRWVILLAMTGPIAALYLWHPSLTPFQVYALRRYVPSLLPLFAIAAGVALDALITCCSLRLSGPTWPRRVFVAGAAGMIAFPLGASLPLRSFQPQAHYLGLVNRVCRTIGPHAAVAFATGDIDGDVLASTVRSWCNVPAGWLTAPITDQKLRVAATRLSAEGRTLWLLGSSRNSITSTVPGLVPHLIGTAVSSEEIQPTLTKPASAYMSTTLTVYATPVAPSR